MQRKVALTRKVGLKPGKLPQRKKAMKKTSKPKYATKERDAVRDAWAAQHDFCWLCKVFGRTNHELLETHEIIERGKSGQPYELFNYARVCGSFAYGCHCRIQSTGRHGRVLALALKFIFDREHLDIEATMRMLGQHDVDDMKRDVVFMAKVAELLMA